MTPVRTYFADTSFCISLLEAGDDHHERAIEWQRFIVRASVPLLTTEPVLWEVLNYFSPPAARQRGLLLYEAVHSRSEVEVCGFNPDLCDAAIRLYSSRPDKEWGVIDCFSFELMRSRELTEALTADHHFEQAGFSALLRCDVPS